MKHIYPILLFLLLFVSSAKADNSKTVLSELDNTIKEARRYTQEREERIRLYRHQLLTQQSDEKAFTLSRQLNKEFQSYQYDSAYAYAVKMLQYADRLNKPDSILESKMALAFGCSSAGLYKEATEIITSIDTLRLQASSKAALFSFLSALYINMSEFAGTEPYYSRYRRQSFQYGRRVAALFPSQSQDAAMSRIRAYQLSDNYDAAIREAEHFIAHNEADQHKFAIVASTLGFFYQVKGDTAKAIENFAKASIADIKMSTKETSALRQLAELLYRKGDIPHAYDYAIQALNDANYYNARQRKIEVGQILPIIESGRFDIIKRQKDKLMTYSAIISLLFVLLLTALFIILRQKKRLNKAKEHILAQNNVLHLTNTQLSLAKEQLSVQNAQLTGVNDNLRETHHIKEEYIGYFFSNNSTYLEKTDEFRKLVARKIRQKQYDELLQVCTSADIRKEREELFVLFDRIFIKLFPQFVNRYNALFAEDERVLIKPEGSLTPEIRIFALIRLGITESERIAKFLDFSLSTVKNYKTKVKNRSLVANEIFEQKIMEIESIQISEKSEKC